MSAEIVSFGAAATAAMLRRNAPPRWIGPFLAQMASMARTERDAGREAFWREVESLLDRMSPLAV